MDLKLPITPYRQWLLAVKKGKKSPIKQFFFCLGISPQFQSSPKVPFPPEMGDEGTSSRPPGS
jgi:hypothetical protein